MCIYIYIYIYMPEGLGDRRHDLYEEFPRLAETRLARNRLSYVKNDRYEESTRKMII